MKRLGRVLALVAAVCVASTAEGPAHADAPTVTITSTPAKIELCPGDHEGRVLVVVRNGGTGAIHNIRLGAFANGPVALDLSDVSGLNDQDRAQGSTSNHDQENSVRGMVLPKLMPGASLSTLLTLKLTRYSPISAAVILWADYQIGGKPDDPKGTAAMSVLDLTAPAAPGTDSLKIETKTDFASLHEGKVGSVLLTISNGTNDTLNLRTSPTVDPSYTKVTPIKEEKSLTVPPQSAVTIPYLITAEREIKPGNYTGLISVVAKTSCGVTILRVASYDVTLGVFGQSELLTILGVPSLLFLPGFLILALWMLLWRFKELGLRVRFLARSPGAEEFFVGVKDAEFWLLGISFSLLMFLILPKVMRLGYSDPYSLPDIATLWALSLFISFLLYLAFLSFDRWTAKKGAALMLTSKDDPLVAVERIAKRPYPRAKCRPVKSKAGLSPEIWGFALWDEEGSTWVIPQIECLVPEGGLSEFDPAKPDLHFSELLRQLREINATKLGAVQWAEESGFKGPRTMSPSELEGCSGELVVVRSP